MYDKFNQYITEFSDENSKNDFWYDVGAIRATEILSKFTQQDWEVLLNEISNKTVEWKRNLAYCLDDANNIYELRALLLLIDTDDEELIEVCADSLRSFINAENKQLILSNKSLIENIRIKMNCCGNATRAVFADFLQRLSN
ncbi:hypothetical protein [Paenibacillus tyrfis]|uniref:HEAT repeat domain-containing protein n=1 Tax=Paenibacillus tyrfis TaxID=1501230 RepID=A0A081NXL4_9BACL|nr:hypothetical protein [Paenibacillus tyrfis]KEQ23187.1 hypothetical protein ET33_17650 [Paenibacillus tyrfis]